MDLQLAGSVQRTDDAVTAGLGDEVVGILAGFQIPTAWDRNTCGEVTMPVSTLRRRLWRNLDYWNRASFLSKKTPRTEFCGAASVGSDLAMVHSANLGLNYAKRSTNPHPG